MKKIILSLICLLNLVGCDSSKTDAELPRSASVSMTSTNAESLGLFSFDGLKHEMSLITIDYTWPNGEHSFEFIAEDTQFFKLDFNFSIEQND
jgi:hypothetical protein